MSATMQSINPANNKLIKEYTQHSTEQVKEIVEAVDQSNTEWTATSFAERAKLLHRTAEVLEADKQQLADLMTEEMGKPVSAGVLEIEKCAWVCRYYADNAEAFLADEPIETEAQQSMVVYRPMGTVLAVMPWNFPFWQVFRFAAPALMAGNTGVLKHASNVAGCALAIEETFKKAGIPENVFRTLLIGGSKVVDVIAMPQIKAVTLTGSTPAGRSVAAAAGKALKKTVLELGGSDPYIVLADADLELAAKKCVQSRMINNGQSCIAAKRFIVVSSVHDQFVNLVRQEMEAFLMADPTLPDTKLGPMARTDLRDELHEQVHESMCSGADALTGGIKPRQEGAWYPATILTNVTKGMPAYDEELFGPVAAIIQVEDTEEAIQVANDTDFGLGAAIFSKDEAKALQIAKDHLDAGCCFVNDFVKSDPRLPFGGIKQSGYGRELAPFGIKEFVNVKTVVLA